MRIGRPISAAVAGLPESPMPTPHVAVAMAARTTNGFLGRFSEEVAPPCLLSAPAGACAWAVSQERNPPRIKIAICFVFMFGSPNASIMRFAHGGDTGGVVLFFRYESRTEE